MTPAQQRIEAAAILTAATSRSLEAVWAVGVILAQHPWDLARSWAGGHLIGHEMHGGTLGGDRWYFSESGRIQITTGAFGPAVLEVAASTVARLIAVDRLPATLVDEVRALDDERSSRARAASDRYVRYQRGEIGRESDYERETRFEADLEVEVRCRYAAARVWERVRPRPKPEQLDLFAALGAAS